MTHCYTQLLHRVCLCRISTETLETFDILYKRYTGYPQQVATWNNKQQSKY